MLKTLLLISPLLLTASSLSASSLAAACVAGTLASYEALPTTGCNVGGLNFSGFGFSSSGSVTIAAANIMVTPITNIIGVDYGLDFTSTGFSVSGTNTSKSIITYLEDPTGPIRSLDDVLDDPVVPPARAQVDTLGCLGAAFAGGICPTSSIVSVSVFDDGKAPQLSASVSFAGQFMLGVQDTVLLEASGTGSASITGFGVGSDLPEPASGWLCAGVIALFLARKQLLKLPQLRVQRRA